MTPMTKQLKKPHTIQPKDIAPLVDEDNPAVAAGCPSLLSPKIMSSPDDTSVGEIQKLCQKASPIQFRILPTS